MHAGTQGTEVSSMRGGNHGEDGSTNQMTTYITIALGRLAKKARSSIGDGLGD